MSEASRSEFETIRLERADAVTWLVLNRPERHNAINEQMVTDISDALALLEIDAATRVVAIRGEGPSFSAGFDVGADDETRAQQSGDPVADHERLRAKLAWLFKVWDYPKPVIAAVHGHCLAGATMLCVLCDITVVAEDARIGVSSLPFGGGFITPLWVHLVGPKRAKQMAFQPGVTITGTEAAMWGWANYSVPGPTMTKDVAELAARIARTPASTLRMKKLAINRLCELQGFRAQAMLGAEMDALLHQSADTGAVWDSLRDNGLAATVADFKRL
jgi:enoyl-CoA hydratase